MNVIKRKKNITTRRSVCSIELHKSNLLKKDMHKKHKSCLNAYHNWYAHTYCEHRLILRIYTYAKCMSIYASTTINIIADIESVYCVCLLQHPLATQVKKCTYSCTYSFTAFWCWICTVREEVCHCTHFVPLCSLRWGTHCILTKCHPISLFQRDWTTTKTKMTSLPRMKVNLRR